MKNLIAEFAVNAPFISKINPYKYPRKKLKELQQQFFKNHTYIFKLLTEREEQVLRLRFAVDDDKFLTLREVGEKFEVSYEMISIIENQAIEKLRSFSAFTLMKEYTDETFNPELFEPLVSEFPSLMERGFVQKTEEEYIGLKFGENIRDKANFFRERTFIFDLLHEVEITVLKLRLGIGTGKYLTYSEIAKKLNIDYEKVSKIQYNTYLKLESPYYYNLLNKYIDKTLDKTVIEKDIISNCNSAIYEDILNAIKQDKLHTTKMITVKDLNINFGYLGRHTNEIVIKLHQAGIKTCKDIIDYLNQNNCSFKNINMGKAELEVVLDGISDLIDKGILEITDKTILENYNRHIALKNSKVDELNAIKQEKFENQLKKVERKHTDKNLKIDDMQFTLRVRNAIRRTGIETLEDLIKFYYDHNESFGDIWDLGVAGEKSVMDKLDEIGVTLPSRSFKR